MKLPLDVRHKCQSITCTIQLFFLYDDGTFLHTKPWIPCGEKSSWLLFTSEDRLSANWLMQQQSMNMTSQCQYPTFAWRHRSTVVHHNAKSKKTVLSENCKMSDWWLFLVELCVEDMKSWVRNKIIHSLPYITIFGSLVPRFANDFHSWLRHSWKSLANSLTHDLKIVIHGNSCIILYIYLMCVRQLNFCCIFSGTWFYWLIHQDWLTNICVSKLDHHWFR